MATVRVLVAVLDTNVLAAGLVAANLQAAPAQLVEAWRTGAYRLVLSEHILGELVRTFSRPYFRRRASPEQVANALAALRRLAMVTSITAQVQGVAPDPADDLVLATAVSGGADYLVTGDRALQQLHGYQGVTILSPREFLNVLFARP